jgi:hypothetical protein
MTICHHLGMTEMKMRSLKNTFNKNDELYTPPILVEPILEYIEDFADVNNCSSSLPLIIWCPFDKKDSEFVKILSKIDYVKVVYSHIDDGHDFFEYEPEEWDIAISNPPFSRKKEVFERLFKLHKPFAMVMNLMAINYQEIGNLFVDKDVQMLIPDKKVSFNGHTSSFCSGYICKDFLPRDLIFCHLENNNTGKDFIPSSMIQ